MIRNVSPSRPDYNAYIHSAEWKKKRLAAFRFYGRHCAICGATKRLEIHHLRYDRLGHEWMIDLQVLCHRCHSRVTFWQRVGKIGGRVWRWVAKLFKFRR